MSDHSECANKIQLLQHECDRSREALTASDERAQRADAAILSEIENRDAYEEVITYVALILGCDDEWSNLHNHCECLIENAHGYVDRASELEATVAALTPLAEEGRKAVREEIGRLLRVQGMAFLLPSQEERLVYLRGLVGEEKAGCQQ